MLADEEAAPNRKENKMRIARSEVRRNENMVVDMFKKFGTANVTLREANDELWIQTGRRMNLNRLIVLRNCVKSYEEANGIR